MAIRSRRFQAGDQISIIIFSAAITASFCCLFSGRYRCQDIDCYPSRWATRLHRDYARNSVLPLTREDFPAPLTEREDNLLSNKGPSKFMLVSPTSTPRTKLSACRPAIN